MYLTCTRLIKYKFELSRFGLIDCEVAATVDHAAKLISVVTQPDAFVWKWIVHSYTFVICFLYFWWGISEDCFVSNGPILVGKMVVWNVLEFFLILLRSLLLWELFCFWLSEDKYHTILLFSSLRPIILFLSIMQFLAKVVSWLAVSHLWPKIFFLCFTLFFSWRLSELGGVVFNLIEIKLATLNKILESLH